MKKIKHKEYYAKKDMKIFHKIKIKLTAKQKKIIYLI